MKCLLMAFLWHSQDITISCRAITRGISSALLEKALVTFWKKCKMQQFRIAKIFGSSFLDFSPAWEKSVWRGRCRRERTELEINLSPFLLLLSFPIALRRSKSTWGWRGRMLPMKSTLCQASLWRALIFMSMNRRPLPHHVSRPGLLMVVYPAL